MTATNSQPATATTSQEAKKTIVYFHVGRGGRFNTSGHKTFRGEKTIEQVLMMADDSGQWSFPQRENQSEIYRMLRKRDLPNLFDLFEKCMNDDDFSAFEKRTRMDLGKEIYVNHNGEPLISKEELETGVGRISWDGDYDTDICQLLSDCDKDELQLIAESKEWNKESLVQQYFDEHTDLVVDWKKFNGDYSNLIDQFFSFPLFLIEDFYESESEEA